jgi:hypothetical protein
MTADHDPILRQKLKGATGPLKNVDDLTQKLRAAENSGQKPKLDSEELWLAGQIQAIARGMDITDNPLD